MSSPPTVQPARYYLNALLNTAAHVTALGTPLLNLMAATVGLKIWKSLRSKSFEQSVLTPIDLHMIGLTVRK